jgi:hypothetical protein
MNNAIAQVIRELSSLLKIPVIAHADAVVFKTESGDEYWLECPQQSPLILLHTELKGFSGYQSSVTDKDKWLTLNTRFDILQGCSIGLHEKTNSVFLSFVLPVKYADATLLKTCLDNLIKISNSIQMDMNKLSISSRKNVDVSNMTLSRRIDTHRVTQQLFASDQKK